MKKYLCYNIRGIQSFIFRIPRLKYIIGGSALIDQFDRETIPNIDIPEGCNLLFSGGGKGTFLCQNDSDIYIVRKQIVTKAHDIGIDIRLGYGNDFNKASKNESEVYPYIPELIDGEPCPASGLYPVVKNAKVHSVVKKRIFQTDESENRKMSRWFEKNLIKGNSEKIHFFRNIDPINEQGSIDTDGQNGAAALGNRNRWAVICMDGNDMGSQVRHMQKLLNDPGEMANWIKAMSKAVDACVREATKDGIEYVIETCNKDKGYEFKEDSEGKIIPIRPLIVGGDDISILCHVSFALIFVEKVIERFNELSIIKNKQFKDETGYDLWGATGGRLTISAGILFCPTTLPLHSAMGYTEALLASAKSKGRKNAGDKNNDDENIPTQSCIDWEHITDTLIDTPAARRQREMKFKDGDTGLEVHLTQRPCTIEGFEMIKELVGNYGEKNGIKEIPASIRHKVLPAMRQGLFNRLAFIAEIAKHYPLLAGHLSEKGYEIGLERTKWDYSQEGIQKTPVIDALLLLEEIQRMSKETINGI